VEPNNREDLASILDAALKQYGDVEPRAGLEARVLSNIRIEQERIGERRWNWTAALAAIAVAGALGAIMFLIRKPDVRPQVVAIHAASGLIAKDAIAVGIKPPRADRPSTSSSRRKPRPIVRAIASADDSPKLEQFPSPRPLSEQEEILARYVRERREEARLVAHAQAELLERDLLEFEKQNGAPEKRQTLPDEDQ
jgi:VirB8 protein